MKLKNPSLNVSYEQPSKLRQVLEGIIKQDDLLLCIGAGKNIGSLAKELPQEK
jgi:hypothetical protein